MSSRFQTLQAIIAAWRSGDVDAVIDKMCDDIVWHYAAPAMPPVRGKAAARKLLARFQADMRDIRWRIFTHVESGDVLFVEGVDEYNTPDGIRIAVPYAGVFEFRGDRVCGWRDYVDLGVIESQKSGAPFSSQVTDLLDRPEAS